MRVKDLSTIIFATSKASDGGMGFLTTNHKEALKNRKKFLKSLGIEIQNTIGLYQQHGNTAVRVKKKDKGKGATPQNNAYHADALITNDKELYLTVLAADCNQIALFDPKQKAIALIHAGRIGLELKIVEKTLKALEKNFQTKPQTLIAQFGPSIGPCCYMSDIWQEAENQLEASGVSRENIFNPKICTFHTNEYFSHRKFVVEKLESDPRFITVFGIKNDPDPAKPSERIVFSPQSSTSLVRGSGTGARGEKR